MKIAQNGKEKRDLISGNYYNIGQLRTELWTEMKLQAYQVARKKNKAELDEGKLRLSKLLKTLREVEQYFAFPGNATLNVIQDFVKHDEFQILKNSIKEILRLLVSEEYRHDPNLFSFATLIKGKENKQLPEGKAKHRYFEVLFVDNLTDREEHLIAKKISDMKMTF